MSGSLHGQRALVTGSTRGIGMAVADALAEAGADLVLTARGTAELKTQQKTLTARHGIRAQVLTADLADAAAVETLARAGLDSFNGLDILVNNAGISNPQPAVDIRVDSWDEVMAVNLRAPALLAARIGQAMSAAGGGRIINIASAAGVRALTDHYAYCTSKAGLVMATKVLALELGSSGVRANVVCPTVVMTEMGQRVWGEPSKAAPMLARIPAGHFASPADVAAAVLYLVSPGAEMLNGVELALDGGYIIS